MAAIREQLSLVDKFSQGFSRFISMAERAAGGSRAAQAATASYERSARAAGSATAQAAAPIKEYSDAVQGTEAVFDHVSAPLRDYESAASQMGQAMSSAAGPLHEFDSAGQAVSDMMSQAAVPLKNYESVINSLQKKQIGLSAQLDAVQNELEKMAQAGQTGTAEFNKLDGQALLLVGKLDLVEGQLASVAQQMANASASAAQMAASENAAGSSTASLSDGLSQAAQMAARFESVIANQNASLNELADRLSEAESELAASQDDVSILSDAYEDLSAKYEKAAKKQNLFVRTLGKVGSLAGKAAGAIASLGRQSKAAESLDKQFKRFALTLFSVSRIINMLKSALEYAPQGVQDSWNALGTSIKQSTFGGIIAALQTIQPHLDALNEKLNSPAGQKFAAGMIMIGDVIGSVVGVALDAVGMLVDFVGNNFATIMTIAAVVVGIFAAQMLLSAAATMAANLPLLLLIGIVAGAIIGLQKLGMTFEEIFTGIGQIFGWFYALVYNIFVDIWNLIASFAEFFANVFDDPAAACVHVIADMADTVLSILQNIAGAIDAIFHSNLSAAVAGWRDSVQGWANSLVGENKIKIDRMEHISYEDAMGDWGNKFGDFGKGLDDFEFNYNDIVGSVDVSGIGGGAVGDIAGSVGGSLGSDVGSIKKEVQMADEDLKRLVDMAEREYVNKINLTSQTPVINVTGQNTGNTDSDRRALANAIRDIILEQRSSASIRSIAHPT